MAKKPKADNETPLGPVSEEAVEAEVVEEVVEVEAVEPTLEDRVTPEPVVKKAAAGSRFGAIAVGVVALIAGGAAVYYLQTSAPDNQAEIERLTAQIEALSAEVSKPEPDTAALAVDRLEGALSQELGGLGNTIGNLAKQLADVDARMADLENQPAPGTPLEVSDALEGLRTDISSWQIEAERLKSENKSLTQAIKAGDDALSAATSEIENLKAQLEAAQVTKVASQNEQLAGVLALIQLAVETGQPFAASAAEYQDIAEMPLSQGLLDASGGVATHQDLQREFPDIARGALMAALKDNGESGTLTRIGDFARAQLGLRSVIAREGDDPDAVLSRAQAAVDGGDFDTALAELEGLSIDRTPELETWIARAQTRQNAVNALVELKGVNQ